MSGLLSYSGLTTKIRAMQSHLLNDQNFREIVELESVPQAVSYLKQHKGYEDLFEGYNEADLHRGQIEKMLRLTVYRDFSKLYRFANVEQRKFLALYFKRYEVSVIKECLNTVFDHRDVVLNLSIFDEFFNKHSQLDINLLASSRTIEELIANLKGTEYYAPLSQLADIERPTLFDYEMTLDLYYFAQMWKDRSKVVTKRDLEELTDLPFQTLLSHDQRTNLRPADSGSSPAEKGCGKGTGRSREYECIFPAAGTNLLCETV